MSALWRAGAAGSPAALVFTGPSPDRVPSPASVARRPVRASPSPLTAGEHRVRLPGVWRTVCRSPALPGVQHVLRSGRAWRPVSALRRGAHCRRVAGQRRR